jgi:hypothetical protein
MVVVEEEVEAREGEREEEGEVPVGEKGEVAAEPGGETDPHVPPPAEESDPTPAQIRDTPPPKDRRATRSPKRWANRPAVEVAATTRIEGGDGFRYESGPVKRGDRRK